jgi:hypothetical protein
MKADHLIRTAIILGAVLTGIAMAAESKPIAPSNTEPGFQRFLEALKKASRSKNASFIYAQLASDYYIDRDYGGSFDPAASPTQNFSASFQFNNYSLSPEFKDHGWREFRRAISGKSLEKKTDGQLCIPHGALETKPFPDSQLCFRKISGRWKIQGHIKGGD